MAVQCILYHLWARTLSEKNKIQDKNRTIDASRRVTDESRKRVFDSNDGYLKPLASRLDTELSTLGFSYEELENQLQLFFVDLPKLNNNQQRIFNAYFREDETLQRIASSRKTST